MLDTKKPLRQKDFFFDCDSLIYRKGANWAGVLWQIDFDLCLMLQQMRRMNRTLKIVKLYLFRSPPNSLDIQGTFCWRLNSRHNLIAAPSVIWTLKSFFKGKKPNIED